jgi:regulator of cell morphogenesis and NO signaling
MLITTDSTVADIATASPATIPVFQQHQIDFCCGGKMPLAQACTKRGLDPDAVLAELQAVTRPAAAEPSWDTAPLSELIAHIQRRYHEHLRVELPRLDAMVDRVVSRHGDHLPETLLPLQSTFKALRDELLDHMLKEDRVLFPAIVAIERGQGRVSADAAAWLDAPIAAMEAEHESAGAALASLRARTNGYAPPEWACPTFRGLYFGLAQLETDMHLHVHLENHILFPRAAQLARAKNASS